MSELIHVLKHDPEAGMLAALRGDYDEDAGGCRMTIEDKLVDLVVDKMGEQTLDAICQPGWRAGIAEELAGPIDQLLSQWMKKKEEEVLLRHNQQR